MDNDFRLKNAYCVNKMLVDLVILANRNIMLMVSQIMFLENKGSNDRCREIFI